LTVEVIEKNKKTTVPTTATNARIGEYPNRSNEEGGPEVGEVGEGADKFGVLFILFGVVGPRIPPPPRKGKDFEGCKNRKTGIVSSRFGPLAIPPPPPPGNGTFMPKKMASPHFRSFD
jgi:hypothetical protein